MLYPYLKKKVLSIRMRHASHLKNRSSKKYRFLIRVRHMPHLQNHKFKKKNNSFVNKGEACTSPSNYKFNKI
jgi:hypothetical protein